MNDGPPPAEGAPASSPGGFWLADLYWRPSRFFRERDLLGVSNGGTLAALLVGIHLSLGRMEDRATAAVLDSWLFYWSTAIAGGLLSGLFYLWFGGWFYRVRLGWSGARDPDKDLARRVYVYASLVFALPTIFSELCKTGLYDTPRLAQASDWSLFLLLFLPWSVVTSYKGVRQRFEVGVGLSRFWFLILPLLFYATVIAVLFVLAITTGGAALESRPDTEDGIRISRPGFSLTYPGNWEVVTGDEDYDPDADFTIRPVFADAMVNFSLYEVPMETAGSAGSWLQQSGPTLDLHDPKPIVRWGRYRGDGFRGTGVIGGDEYTVILFCGSSETRSFDFMRISIKKADEKLEPGFALIRDSFELRGERPTAAPEAEDGLEELFDRLEEER